MKISELLVDEKVIAAELALEQATAENIVELGNAYLELLASYREMLYTMSGDPDLSLAERSRLGRELIEQSRKAVRAAIELSVNERKRVETLIESFTLINGWDAAATFNRLHHKDATDWELHGSEVRIPNSGERMNVVEAVATAGLLRRNAYVTNKTTFSR